METPADLAATQPGAAREAQVRRYLGDEVPEDQQLDSVVLLDRTDGAPTARVWTRRATDDTVEDFVRDALKNVHRREVFVEVGIDPVVVQNTERFRPKVTALSPQSATGARCPSATVCRASSA